MGFLSMIQKIRNIISVSVHMIGWSTVCMLSACSTVPQDDTIAERQMADSLSAHSAYESDVLKAQPPAQVDNSLLSSAMQGNSASLSVKPEPRFDISVNQVPARTFFVSLVADSGVNVVAHPEISGAISLELKNVTVREALNVTRDVYGYEYKFADNIYTIYPRKLRTQVFPINYLDIKRVGLTDTAVTIGQISGSSQNNRNGSNSNNNSDNQGTSLIGGDEGSEDGSRRRASVPGARVQTLNSTDFWQSIQTTIEAIIGGQVEGRMVMTNPQSGLVIVNALPNELSAVREFLERSELSVRRQVVLETKIIEVQLNDDYEAGINWGAISGALSTGSESVLNLNYTSTGGSEVSSKSRATQNFVSSVLNVTDISELLNLLDTQGNVQVLSSPRISTVNNQKAIIRVGTDEFFVTGISNNTTTSASSIQNTPEVLLDSFFSGIALDVTPQIAEDGDVIIHVHPLVSNVEDQIKDISVGDEKYTLPLALRDVRESDSIVRASSGQVVVLGGLMQETTADVSTKRPFLGDIPVVNVMFKARSKRKVKTELVILMRPIVVDKGTWEEQLHRSNTAIEAISDAYRQRED